jgi:hypothetical protein
MVFKVPSFNVGSSREIGTPTSPASQEDLNVACAPARKIFVGCDSRPPSK